jgi:PRC-barrel domain
MMKHTMTAAALAVALATPAFAQQTKPMTPPTSSPSSMSDKSMPATGAKQAGFIQSQQSNEFRSSKLVGTSVYGPGDKSIGDVNDVLIGNHGEVRAVVIGVGGFLGVGEKNVAVPFDTLTITRKAGSNAIDKISTTYSKDDLKNAPKFAYYQASKSETTGEAAPGAMRPTTPTTNSMKK